MPDENANPLLGPALGAIGGLATSAISAANTGRLNKRSERFSAALYQRQKLDNLEFWNLQNAYNSPEAQMERLEAAGLNPNLVYGASAPGNNASTPQTPDTQRPEYKTPDLSGLSEATRYVTDFQNYEIRAAQKKAIEAQITVSLEEAALKAAQRQDVEQNVKRSKFDLDLDTELREISAEARRENLRKLSASADYTISENERRAAQLKGTLTEQAERILLIRQQTATNAAERARIRVAIEGLKTDNELKELERNLMKAGISKNDQIYWRVLGTFLDKSLNNQGPLSGVKDWVGTKLDKFLNR